MTGRVFRRIVQREQCRPDLRCVSCGARLGDRHDVLCYVAIRMSAPITATRTCARCGQPVVESQDHAVRCPPLTPSLTSMEAQS